MTNTGEPRVTGTATYDDAARESEFVFYPHSIVINGVYVSPMDALSAGMGWMLVAGKKGWPLHDAHGQEIDQPALLREFVERILS